MTNAVSNIILTGRRDEDDARIEEKVPSVEQEGRKKEADEFNLTFQEGCSGFDELINQAIDKFGKRLPKELYKIAQKVEKMLMTFGKIDILSLGD